MKKSIVVNDEKHTKLKIEAVKRNISMSDLLDQIISEWVIKQDPRQKNPFN